jgi:phage-related protein
MCPRTISSTALAEKNKLTTDSVFIVLLKITIPGVGTPVYVAANNESVTWNSQTWQPFPFENDDMIEESKGEVPQIVVRVGNESRVMEQYLQNYDAYTKTNGFSPISCDIYVVNSKNLGSATPETQHTFDLKQAGSDARYAYFTLSANNPWNRRSPLNRILRNQCRWIFKSSECGYAGATTTCNKTISACRAMSGGSNSKRYGGYSGVGNKGVRVYGV